jgi:hypothetical protein
MLLVSSLVILAIALPIALFNCFSSEQTLSCLSSRSSFFATGCLTLLLICLTFWGLQTRKRYGKWLAVSLLMGGMVVAIAESHSFQLIYRSITEWQPLPAPPHECWEGDSSCGYSSYLELALRIVSDLLRAMLLGFLAARLLYSDAAKQFFH